MMKSFVTPLKPLALATALGLVCSQAYAKDVSVHLFEWTWPEIAEECENFLGPKGYNAVQISPPNEHVNAPGDVNNAAWWVRYQPVSFTNLTSRSGTEAQLADMIRRCDAVGVKVIADAVINHMANYPAGSGVGSGGSVWNSNNASYPGMNGWGTDFHTCKTKIDWSNKESVWGCQLSAMPDINTGNPQTQDKLVAYLKKLTGMGVYGFRIDAAKSIRPAELDTILTKAGKPWTFLEVIDNGDAVGLDDYSHLDYLLTEFDYGSKMLEMFKGGQLKWLKTFGSTWFTIPSDKALVFVTNHDRERGHGGKELLHYKDPNGAQNLASVFMLAHPFGTPTIHSSFEYFGDDNRGRPVGKVNCASADWICQHRWGNIANMVAFRNEAGNAPVANWWDNGSNAIAFSRGDRGFVMINNQNTAVTQRLQTGLPQGQYCDVLSHANECDGTIVDVDANGFATITAPAYGAAAIHRGFQVDAGEKPNAVIIGAVERAAVGDVVVLDASPSFDNDGHIVSYQWSSGEKTPSITKTLNTAGKVSFTVTVTDNDGMTAEKTVTIQVGDLPPQSKLPSVNFRGTANGWANTPMVLVSDFTWQTEVTFNGQANQRFKFDVKGDWSQNYGDNGANGSLEQTGADIMTPVIGRYLVTLFDDSMTYSIKLAGPVDNKPVAVVSPTAAKVEVGESVTLSAAESTDDNGIDDYSWSTGENGDEIVVSFDKVGTYKVKVTVTDTAGQTADAEATITVIDSNNFVSTLPKLHFRGTANGWTAKAMTLIGNNTWATEVDFDGQSNQRFKFDVHGDWSYNFGDNNKDGKLDQTGADIYFATAGRYQVVVNDQTMSYSLKRLEPCTSCNFTGKLPSLNFRGTANGWTSTPMKLVANNIWQVEVTLDGQVNQRFKVDVKGDWSQNYGDNNKDGILDGNGADIYTGLKGSYLLSVDDRTMSYSLSPR